MAATVARLPQKTAAVEVVHANDPPLFSCAKRRARQRNLSAQLELWYHHDMNRTRHQEIVDAFKKTQSARVPKLTHDDSRRVREFVTRFAADFSDYINEMERKLAPEPSFRLKDAKDFYHIGAGIHVHKDGHVAFAVGVRVRSDVQVLAPVEVWLSPNAPERVRLLDVRTTQPQDFVSSEARQSFFAQVATCLLTAAEAAGQELIGP